MSNNKQSSVEWLFCQLIDKEYKNPHDTELISIIEQAKIMHKEEIEKTIDMSRNLCKISDIDGYDEYQYTKEEILEKILKVNDNEQQ